MCESHTHLLDHDFTARGIGKVIGAAATNFSGGPLELREEARGVTEEPEQLRFPAGSVVTKSSEGPHPEWTVRDASGAELATFCRCTEAMGRIIIRYTQKCVVKLSENRVPLRFD